jgi:Holliday junction resolvase-like predicted endonuclease
MVIERELIVSLLKLTKNGPVSIDGVRKDAKVASDIAEKSLEKLQNEDMLHMKGDFVEVDGPNRIKLAVRAVSLGADIEHVSGFLRWQEFEGIAAVALENNGYVVSKNVRFKQAGRRWEIDVVGCRKPLVICLDCKHWHHRLSPSALVKIAEAQVERTEALAESLPNLSVELGCAMWSRAKFVPAILALLPSSFKFHETVPIVPVLQLQDFVNLLPAYADSLTHFTKEFSHLRHDFQD